MHSSKRIWYSYEVYVFSNQWNFQPSDSILIAQKTIIWLLQYLQRRNVHLMDELLIDIFLFLFNAKNFCIDYRRLNTKVKDLQGLGQIQDLPVNWWPYWIPQNNSTFPHNKSVPTWYLEIVYFLVISKEMGISRYWQFNLCKNVWDKSWSGWCVRKCSGPA